MEQSCKDHRGVVQYRFDVHRNLSGSLFVQVSHRHFGGDWSFWHDTLTQLSDSELYDFVEAKTALLNHRHPWLEAGEQGSLFG